MFLESAVYFISNDQVLRNRPEQVPGATLSSQALMLRATD